MKRRRLLVVAGVLHARSEPVERGRDLVVVRSEHGLEDRQDVPQRLLRLAMPAASVEDRRQRTTVGRHLEVVRTDVHVAGFGHVPTMHHAGRGPVEVLATPSLDRFSTGLRDSGDASHRTEDQMALTARGLSALTLALAAAAPQKEES
jgi:hypothetical protein